MSLRPTIYLAVLLAVLSFTWNHAFAEEVLRWEDCVKEAISRNPDLVSAEEQTNQAKAQKDITRSALLPQITGSASGSKYSRSIPSTTSTYQYSADGQQLIFDGFQTVFNVNAAKKNIEAYRYNFDVTSSNVRYQLRTAFAQLLGAQDLVHVAENIVARRKYSLGLIRLRYEGGREHKGSLMLAQSDLASANYELEQAKRQVAVAQQGLAKAMGRDFFVPVKANGNFIVRDANKERPDFYAIAETNPFLKEVIAQKEAAALGVKSAIAAYFPQIYATASGGQINTNWPPNQSQWTAGLNLSVPLYQGGLNRATLSKAKAALGQAKAEEKSAKDGIVLTLAQTWKTMVDAAEKVEVDRQALEAAQTRAKIAEAQYSNGLILFDNWIIIEDNLVKSEKAYIVSEIAALVAEASWIQAKGGTLDYDRTKGEIKNTAKN